MVKKKAKKKVEKKKNTNSAKKIGKINMEELGFDKLPTEHQLAVIIFKMDEMIDVMNDLSLKINQFKPKKPFKKGPKKKTREQLMLEAQVKRMKEKKKT